MGYREEREAGRQRQGSAPAVPPAQRGGGIFNIPLPAGAAGADPAVLAAAGQNLGAIMQGGMPDINTLAGGGMGFTPISTAAQEWDRQQSFYEEYNLKRLAQFDRDLDQAIQAAEMNAASAAEVAQIYASAGMAEAASAAQSKVEAANIAAQAMRDVAQMDNATRMQIANLQAEVERERIQVDRRIQESREFGQPINLASYIHYMTQGPGTAVPGALPQQAVPQAPTAATGAAPLGGTASLYQMGMPGQMGTPAAIVGEPGAAGQAQPELLSVTPQGVQVTPIASQQVKPLQQMLGVPRMQFGGTIRTSGSSTPMWGGSYTPKSTLIGPKGTPYAPGGHTAGTGPSGSFTVPPITLPSTSPSTPSKPPVYGQPTAPSPAPAPEPTRTGQPVGPGQPLAPTPDPDAGKWDVILAGYWNAPQGAWNSTFWEGAIAKWGQPVIDWLQRTHGWQPGQGATPTPTPTPAPATGEFDWQAFIDQLYGNVPQYSWTGSLELPGVGATLPYAPYGQNVTDWQRLPWQVQQGKLSMWRALGIMPETAMGMMYAAAPTGIAQPVPRRG